MRDYSAWIPQEYLAQYYSTAAIAEDEQGIIGFIIRFFKEKRLHFTEMLEIGCGPTIHHAIPFVPHVGSLYLADYLEGNLREIGKVIYNSPDAHNWRTYLSGTLELEGFSSAAAIEQRLQDFKKKVSGLHHCDVLNAFPVGEPGRVFPLVTSFYTLECVSTEKKVWRKAMSNVASLVASEGWIILSAICNANGYQVGNDTFPVTSVNEHDMRKSLLESGFTEASIEVCPCEWGAEGFDSIMVCCAKKR
jgi:hypothetical protein